MADDPWLEKVPGIKDIVDDTEGGRVVMPRESMIILKGAVQITPKPGAIELDFTGTDGPGGTGDVVGPASATPNRLPKFADGTGKLLSDSGIADTDVVLRTGAVPFTGDQSFGGHKGTNAADAVSATGLTTLQQVTAAINAAFAAAVSTIADFKQSARFATTIALPASTLVGNVRTANANGAFPTVDGVTAAVGDRFLDKDNATGSQRILYTLTNAGSAGTPWVITRATDFDASAEVTAGATVVVTEGTANGPGNANGGNVFMLTTPDPIVLGTTSLTWSRIGTMLPDGATLVVSGGVIVRAALTGDVTASQGSNATTIANGAVSNAKLAASAVTDTKVDAAAGIAFTKMAAAALGQSPIFGFSNWAMAGVLTRATALPNSAATLTSADGNRSVLSTGTLSANRTYVFDASGFEDLEVHSIERYDTGAFTLRVEDTLGTEIYTFPGDGVKRMLTMQVAGGVVGKSTIARLTGSL